MLRCIRDQCIKISAKIVTMVTTGAVDSIRHHYLQLHLPLSLLAPSLTLSFTPSLPPSLLAPSLTLSFTHSLAPFLSPPSLPLSSLPFLLVHSLTPSLPLSPLPFSLVHSLPPSFLKLFALSYLLKLNQPVLLNCLLESK